MAMALRGHHSGVLQVKVKKQQLVPTIWNRRPVQKYAEKVVRQRDREQGTAARSKSTQWNNMNLCEHVSATTDGQDATVTRI